MIRLAVVMDTRLYRQGLCELLRADARCDVAGECGSDDAGVNAIGALEPEIILLDSGVRPGPDFCLVLRRVSPASRIVLLGVDGEIERVVRWAEAGVAGFVAQDRPIGELVTAIEVAARGDFVCPRDLVRQLVVHLARTVGPRLPFPLTARELQIVALLERGRSNKEIARQLGIEVATTKNHVHHILEKLQVRRRSEAAALLRGTKTDNDRLPTTTPA